MRVRAGAKEDGMTKERKHYTPWSRTEEEDLQVQEALDKASANQMAGFVDELLDMADKAAEEESEGRKDG